MATKKKITALGDLPLRDDVRDTLSQAEIDEGSRKVLLMLSDKLRQFAERKDMSKLRIRYSESKPLKPVYTDGGKNAVGYIEQGPRILSLIIENFTNDGRMHGIGE
jgi:hypothetical protein